MKINETFVRTSENYGINSFDVPIATFKKQNKEFCGFSTNFNGKIKYCKSDTSSLCKEANEQLKSPNVSLEIEINKQLEPLKLNFDFSNDDYLVDKIKLKINEGISADIVLNYTALRKVYHNGFVSIECGKNAKVNFVVLNDMGKDSESYLTFENSVKESSELKFTMIDFSGKYSVTKYVSNITGNNASSTIKNMYLSSLNSQIDLNFAQNIYGENSVASIKTVGALQGKSIKNFKGMIDFKNGSTKSKGDEEEYCLLLSKEAKSKALPILCCSEEDVDGSHSSATGKIGDKELFYIMSRGLDKTEALKMLLKAKLNKVLDDIYDFGLKNQINEKIDRMIINEKN